MNYITSKRHEVFDLPSLDILPNLTLHTELNNQYERKCFFFLSFKFTIHQLRNT